MRVCTTAAITLLAVAVALSACSSGSKAAGPPASTTTTWASLPPSAKQARGGAVSVFPAPGTVAASPQSEISIRGRAKGAIGAVTVVGSVTGLHAGRLAAHADGMGASFVPAKPFAPGESVTVSTKLRVRGTKGGTFRFTVARPAPDVPAQRLPAPAPTGAVRTFSTQPQLRMTEVQVSGDAGAAAPGLIFVAPRRGVGEDAIELLRSDGSLVWFDPLDKGVSATDFREQTYQGQPVLTWWQGTGMGGHGYGVGVIADDHYQRIATVKAGNGYSADLHEFELTSRNTAFVTAYRVVHWNLTSVGGPANGLAVDSIAQEVEPNTGRVLFEWHSLGNVPLADSYAKPPTDGTAFDYFHINSITSDASGDVLVSGRGTHTLYELDGRTAAIHWRMGGKHSDFSLGEGVPFNSQHDAKWLDASTLSIFDNGAGVGGNDHKTSRGIIVNVDRAARRVSLVEELAQPEGDLFRSQGDVEKLPDGHWFVGWGEGPYATEYDADGKPVFELQFASGSSYRAYRFPWTGHPTGGPAVTATRSGAQTLVAASWNGATEVATWEVLAGPQPDQLTTVASAAASGFETQVAADTTAAYVAVRALDAQGTPLATSTPVAVTG